MLQVTLDLELASDSHALNSEIEHETKETSETAGDVSTLSPCIQTHDITSEELIYLLYVIQ